MKNTFLRAMVIAAMCILVLAQVSETAYAEKAIPESPISFWAKEHELEGFYPAEIDEKALSPDPVLQHFYKTEKERQSFTYHDSSSGISFTVLGGWKKVDFKNNPKLLKAKFQIGDSGIPAIMYGSVDLWSLLDEEGQKEISRAAYDTSYITREDMAEMLGISEKKVFEVYSGDETYYLTRRYVDKTINDSVTTTTPLIQMVTVKGGWLFAFQFGGEYASVQYDDFEALIKSVDYRAVEPVEIDTVPQPSVDAADVTASDQAVNLIVSLIATIVVYSLPIIIYRYTIRKAPLPVKKAKSVTIIYAVIGFIVMSVLCYLLNGHVASGGGLLLWSFVNYKMLSSGKQKEAVTHQKLETDEAVTGVTNVNICSDLKDLPPTRFCHHCGTEIIDESLFCHHCGTRIIKE